MSSRSVFQVVEFVCPHVSPFLLAFVSAFFLLNVRGLSMAMSFPSFFLKSVGFSRDFFSVCCARGVPCTSVFRKSDTWGGGRGGGSQVVSWVLSIFSPATIILCTYAQ